MKVDARFTDRRRRALVESLSAGRLMTGAMLSELHGVSLRTIYRDIAGLQRAGVPVKGQSGVGYMLARRIAIPQFLEDKDMSFRLTAPSIPLDAIEWTPTGDASDPAARLLAHIRIGSLDMHLEAWEVDRSQHSIGDMQEVRAESRRADDFDTLCGMMDCTFETIMIAGREYVLVAVPYGR